MNELLPSRERWPCGCAIGVTPHGAGWSDCVFTNDDRLRMEATYDGYQTKSIVLANGKTRIWSTSGESHLDI